MPLHPTPPPRPTRGPRPRRTLRLLGAVLVALLAMTSAACVRGENSSSSDNEATGSGTDGTDGAPTLPDCPVGAHLDADGVVEVELWHTMVGETQNNLNALVEEYNAGQDKVKILARSQGTDYDEALRKFIAGIPSRQLPAIVYLEDTVLRQVTDTGTVLPAEACEAADDDFAAPGDVEAVRNYYTSEGVYWTGYPNVSTPVLYLNAVHFRAAGLDPDDPPETLEELRETARALKEEAGVDKPLAFLLNSWYIESWITGAGESVVNMDNGRGGMADESTFDNPATHEIYTWIKEMVDEGLMDAYSDSESQINHFLAVAQKNSSMVIETSTAATLIKTVLGGGGDDLAEDAGIGVDPSSMDFSGIEPVAAPYPGLSEAGKVRVSGGAFYMTNTVSEAEQAGAWDFMKFMWETDSQVAWHLLGSYLPTTEEASSDPRVVEYWETDMAGRLLKVSYDQLQTIDPERPGPQVGPQSSYDEAIKNSLDRLALQGESVDSAIARADEEIGEALARYIEDNG